MSASHVTVVECGECAGHGWCEEVIPGHDLDCDGSCRNCPVPIPGQAPCRTCGGNGTIEVPDPTAPPGDEEDAAGSDVKGV